MTFSRRSSDVGFYNGPNPDISGCENVFVCTLRCNQGEVAVTTYAQTQTGWVAQQLGSSSEYVFNGPFDAYTVGVTFAQHCLFAFVVGKSGILIDCEDEGDTNTHAWGSKEAIDFATGVRSVRPDIPWSAFFPYFNKSVNDRFNWQPCVDLGMGRVYARPGGPDDYGYWPNPDPRYIKQDGTVNGLDADWHNTAWADIIATPEEEENDMPLIIQCNDVGGGIFALDGGKLAHIIENGTASALHAAGSKVIVVSLAELQNLQAQFPAGNPTLSTGDITVTVPDFDVTLTGKAVHA
ncbi:hypothetical protein HII28_02225 [Planctomonas sp. JC2975]|uniref:hypothetical protein n=1 Tax=Planctomonas sp. JC2975 TaxID=2729626 RepID=UPI0014739B66|nr:hypothetical protein [Planctomonas sp. JC2975]NNC10704.1 hypothetical protein [Planctomonas sp. JC2975]